MALFKILKGNKSNLPQTYKEGYMYITEDTGDIYVDISNSKRIQLNAEMAEKIRTENQITLTVDPEEGETGDTLTIATKEYVNDMIGDIATLLEAI